MAPSQAVAFADSDVQAQEPIRIFHRCGRGLRQRRPAGGVRRLGHGAHVAGSVAEGGAEGAAEVRFAGKAQASGYFGYP